MVLFGNSWNFLVVAGDGDGAIVTTNSFSPLCAHCVQVLSSDFNFLKTSAAARRISENLGGAADKTISSNNIFPPTTSTTDRLDGLFRAI